MVGGAVIGPVLIKLVTMRVCEIIHKRTKETT